VSKKTVARFNAKGYGDAGASHKKRALKGFNAQSGSPQQDIDFHNYTMRQRARMLYMASPLATSAIKNIRTNVVGQGLTLSAKVDRSILGLSQDAASEWQRRTEKEFALWAENRWACDAMGINDFYELQQIAAQAWVLSGDVFCLFKGGAKSAANPYDLCLHLVEADRVSTPTVGNTFYGQMTEGTNQDTGNDIHDGVEVDAAGRVVAYHISSAYPGELPKSGAVEWCRVEAIGKETGLPNVLHLMDAERPDQYRGVSYLAPVIEPLLQIRRYTETEITAAQVESCFAGFIKTNANPDDLPMNETGEVGANEPSDPNEFNFGPGEFNVLKPGEDITFSDPKRPANGFAGFVRAIAEQVGAALEIPAEILLKAFNASYSASRGALLEAWKMFRMRRAWFEKDFCKPVYEAWLAEAVALGRIQAPGFFADPVIRKAWSGSEWAGPSQGQLNPVQEIQAEILAVHHGFSTHEQSTVRLNGGNWTNNVERLAVEQAQLAAVKPLEVNNYE
jgi:lambda family phage portal protein